MIKLELTEEQRRFLLAILKQYAKDTNGFISACIEPEYSTFLMFELGKCESIIKQLEAADGN
jgi:hypothetical protein